MKRDWVVAGILTLLISCTDATPDGSSSTADAGPTATATAGSTDAGTAGQTVAGGRATGIASNPSVAAAGATDSSGRGEPAGTGGVTGSAAGTSSAGSGGTTTVGAAGASGTSVGSAGAGGSYAGANGSSAGASGSSAGADGSQATKWVGTWAASPYYDSGNQPPASLSNSVLRQVVHVSLGGSKLRFQFSNLQGNGPVTLKSVHVALCRATPSVDSTIDAATDTALSFSGMPSVTLAQGEEVWSDTIDFVVPPLGNVTITAAFGSVPSSVVGHSGSRTTSYLQTDSSDVTTASMTSAQKFQHWYYISGIEVMAPDSAVSVVAVGDSITDGRGTDDNRNNRWTDILAARLQSNAATMSVAVLNQGIGATNLIGNSGTAAQARFNRDVLAQSGVKYAIVLDGVNDIGGGASFSALKSAYDDLIARAHAKGVLIYGGTITPFGGSGYYSTSHEMVRQQVNDYIRGGAFDGYIDFDAALTDGGNPPKMQASYASWAQQDGLHPGPAGYQAMGEAADLSLFAK